MQSLRVRVQTIERAPAASVAEEGEFLAGLVRRSLLPGGEGGEERQLAPVAVAVRGDRTELLDLRPLVKGRVRPSSFLAGLSRSGGTTAGWPRAVGLAGRFQLRAGEHAAPVSVALAFLEWPDCRWWHWQVLLDADGQPLEHAEIRRAAEAGDPLPSGLGRWWSLGRRAGMRIRYRPVPVPQLDPIASPHVH